MELSLEILRIGFMAQAFDFSAHEVDVAKLVKPYSCKLVRPMTSVERQKDVMTATRVFHSARSMARKIRITSKPGSASALC